MIKVIDYGLGNLGSIVNMLKRVGFDATIINSPEDLENASHLILPGVGAFDTGIRNLQENGWIEPLNQKVLVERVPTMGICLGMQLMTKSSEEGQLPGLGWIDAHVRKFTFDSNELRIPHMGWSKVNVTKESSILPFNETDRKFYFVHSYFVHLDNPSDQLIEATYGRPFTAGFEVSNIIGIQCHPEKSHRYGMELFRNFAANSWNRRFYENKSNPMPAA